MHAETADSLSLTFLHLLEKLSPVERAVFLLREVFDYSYGEIGAIVGKSPENCRQILTRAVEEGRRRFEVSREEQDEVARRFVAAWEDGDVERLIELLAPDATVYGDGGGKAGSRGRGGRARRGRLTRPSASLVRRGLSGATSSPRIVRRSSSVGRGRGRRRGRRGSRAGSGRATGTRTRCIRSGPA
jgi:ketosteroid isomerase-like protein